MSPLAVFVRTLLKSSAIFIGAAAIFLHPNLEFRSATGVGARPAPREAMIDALIGALDDPDAGVRQQVARTLAAKSGSLNIRRRAIGALAAAGDRRAIEIFMRAIEDADADADRDASARPQPLRAVVR